MVRSCCATVLALVVANVACGDAGAAVRLRSDHGLKIVSVKQVDPRVLDVTFATKALPEDPQAYILLPPGYEANRTRRYPVFYLLDGTSGFASDWFKLGHAEEVIGNRPLITVMPDITLNGDGGGWCTDWPDGKERWETFHIGQLIPWVDANLRTMPDRGHRAIAGLSQGGFCSTSYAARHPDLFSVALAYSGAPDIAYDAPAHTGARTIINATEVGLTHVPPNTFFGDPQTDFVNWAAHDPATLAPNLRWTKLFMYFGNGTPGPLDSNPVNPGAEGIEGAVYYDNIFFHNRLNALQIPSLYDPYGNGTHIWPYWERDLRWSIGAIARDLTRPAPDPASFSYTSAGNPYGVYGWRVRVTRAVREFSTLAVATRRTFLLQGSGRATVLTPPWFRPGTVYEITTAGRGATTHETARADRRRRLTITVPLGPSNARQEYSVPGSTAGTTVYSTQVTISER